MPAITTGMKVICNSATRCDNDTCAHKEVHFPCSISGTFPNCKQLLCTNNHHCKQLEIGTCCISVPDNSDFRDTIEDYWKHLGRED